MSDRDFLEKLLDGAAVDWMPISQVTLLTRNIRWSEVNRTVRYIDLTSVDIKTRTIVETKEITADTAPSRAQKLVETDDLIFATTRPTQQRYCLIGSDFSGEVASTGYCVLRADQSTVLPKWLLHWVGSREFKQYVEEQQSGAAYPAISDGKVKAFQIPIPYPEAPEKSLATQAEIVRILDSFTELTAELTAELKARKRQYAHYRDKLLNFDNGDVQWKTLGDVSSVITKGTTPKSYASEGVSFVKTEAFNGSGINKNKLNFIDEVTHKTILKRSILEVEDILFTIAGATIGKIAMVDRSILPANTNQALAIIRLDASMNKKFVFYLLSSGLMEQYIGKSAKGSAQPNLNLKQLNDFPIPVPTLAEQTRIVAILDKFNTLTNSLSEGLPCEIELRKQQYEYYRDLLLNFPRPEGAA